MVLLKYFCAGFQYLWEIEELQGEGKGWFVTWTRRGGFAKNCFECVHYTYNSFSILPFFPLFQEKKEHKCTQRAAAKKLKDRHDASLAHPHFSSWSGDSWSFCPSLPPGLGPRSSSKSLLRPLTVPFSWLGSQQTGTLWFFPFIIPGTLQQHRKSSLQSKNSGRLSRGSIPLKTPIPEGWDHCCAQEAEQRSCCRKPHS